MASEGASRSLGEGLADAAVGLYRWVEQQIIALVTQLLKRSVPQGQDWASTKMASASELKARVEQLLASTDASMRPAVKQAIGAAWARGQQSADNDLSRLVGPRTWADSPATGTEALARLNWSTQST